MARRGGWSRVGSKRRFRYVDARGQEITDEGRLARIESLVIPPAWQDVWISPSARAKLQAVGIDAAGRRQYLYHPEFRAAQEQAKYDRLVLFAERLPALRHAMADHMDLDSFDRERVCALAVRLINLAWFRVGSERYARSSRTYGVTTLSRRHVRVERTRISFRFRAKHRALVRTTLVDAELAAAMRELLELPGRGRLFRYWRDGDLINLTGTTLNAYVREHLGDEFTAKDFRTWGGTLTAAIALAEHGTVESTSEAKRVVAAVMRNVGERLGNTPAVARVVVRQPGGHRAVSRRSHPGGLSPARTTGRGRTRPWPRPGGGCSPQPAALVADQESSRCGGDLAARSRRAPRLERKGSHAGGRRSRG